MKKLKSGMAAAVLAALTLALSACGSKAQEVDIDQMAADLSEKVSFVDELSQVDESVIPMLYSLEYSDAVLYMGSGATAEEVAVFACADSQAAQTALEGAKAHIESQKEAYENYVPEEVKRLDSAVLQQQGKYVVVVVTEDSQTAQDILEEYWG